MKREDFDVLMKGIKEKLGNENVALISDDIGTLTTDNTKTLTEIENLTNDKKNLNEDKERLIRTNGQLLLQIEVADEQPTRKELQEEKEKKKISLKDVFDEKGNFKK